MLARLERTLPRGPEWRYEPKFDGFRGLLSRSSSGTVHLLSRNLKDPNPAFPELVRAGAVLPHDTLLDGEIVIADSTGAADFGALQDRLGAGRRAAETAAAARPAVLLAFDLPRHACADLSDMPLFTRRTHLEVLLEPGDPCLQLIVQTSAIDEAEDWLTLLPGIEGVVARRDDSRYLPGQRERIKVKRQRPADCVVIGVAGELSRPSLVLGLRHPDANFHHFGVCRRSSHMLTDQLATVLQEAGREQRPIPSRWQHVAVPAWRPVPPTVDVEVEFTVLDGKRWLRHAARFVRWRPDRSPEECGLDQLGQF
jgi:ATP-dependent DNA ligase